MNSNVLTVTIREWKCGKGYAVIEEDEFSKNVALITSDFRSAVKFAREIAREQGVDTIHVMARINVND